MIVSPLIALQRDQLDRLEELGGDLAEAAQLNSTLYAADQREVLEALQELTSEKVRGDQLFAIFLAQCAALSEKIQMRMLYGCLSGRKPTEGSGAAAAGVHPQTNGTPPEMPTKGPSGAEP